ncbi:MAG: helix-turn-helix domain-containing protein [Nitratireductor sp.]|nr:helix-turn-helix domain-containing protein [Nitratireductor sp.]
MSVLDSEKVNRLLTENEAGDYLNVSVRTLQSWRLRGGGPAYAKLGKAVRYRQGDLDAWVEANLTRSTSQSSIQPSGTL